MKTYEYLLFDWDGCLADTLSVWLRVFKKVYAQYGVHPTDQEITRQFGDWEAPKYFGIKDVDGCMKQVEAEVAKGLKQVRLFDGVKEMLEELATTKRLALISTSKRDMLETGLKYNGIAHCFTTVIGADDVRHHKPHPESLEKALKALGGTKDAAIMIGDSRKDLGAAENAGIDSALIHTPAHESFYALDELRKYNPTHIARNYIELQQILVGE